MSASSAYMKIIVAMMLAATAAFSTHPPRVLASFRSARRAGYAVAIVEPAFDALSLEEKVAVVRVANGLGMSDGPLEAPEQRPEWSTPSNETWAAVKAEYPVLEALADETLQTCVAEVKAKAAPAPTAATSEAAGLSAGAAPLGLAAITIAALLFLASGSPDDSVAPTVDRARAEKAARQG